MGKIHKEFTNGYPPTRSMRFRITAIFCGLFVIVLIQGAFALHYAQGTRLMPVAVGIAVIGLLLTVSGGILLIRSCVMPLRQLLRVTQHLANGDFSLPISVTGCNEIGQLQAAMKELAKELNWIVEDINALTKAGTEGSLSTRADASRYKGEFAGIIHGIDAILDAVTHPLYLATEYMDHISRGNLPNRITDEYQGDFNTMIQALNRLIDAMNEITWLAIMIAGGTLDLEAKERSEQDRLMKAFNTMIQQLHTLQQETNGLIRATQNGHLATRINTDAFTGGWQNFAAGMNNVVDAFVPPFTTAAAYIARIAKGDIPNKITEEYQGDFNELKHNLNLLIGSMTDITLLAGEMAHGNLSVEVREHSEQDTLMQALNSMIHQLKAVVGRVKTAADDSAEHAEEVSTVVAEMVAAIQKIAGKIVIIQNIATQTRMLSLNATIEAARAQEQGRAFAVVAAEVRQLSDVTQKAADEINQLAALGLDISTRFDEMFSALVPSIYKTAELVQDLCVAANESDSQ